MAKSGAPVKDVPKGYIIARTEIADIREMMALPPEEQDAAFAAWFRKGRLEAEERARLKIDAILDEYYVAPDHPK
jgi:hypothetical protein